MTFDIKTAFLHGELEEEVYIKIPEGYNAPGKVCLLKKALYGLRQAPSKWNKKLTGFLRSEGMENLKTDQCIFVNKSKTVHLAIHVDDGIVIGRDMETMKQLLKKLKDKFQVRITENLKSYLGMEVKKDRNGIFISQGKYAQHVIEKYNMNDSHARPTPIAPQKSGSETVKEEQKFPCRETVGSLLYLSGKTRPDMAYAVNFESRTLEKPEASDVQNIKRTLRYLNGTQDCIIP